MGVKVIDIVNTLFKADLNEESQDISIPLLVFWVRSNIGTLNNLLGTSFALDSTTKEILDSNGNLIDGGAASIFRYLFLSEYYARQARRFLGAGSYDINIAQSVQNALGGDVRLVDRNQIAQTFLKLKNDNDTRLRELVNKYKFSNQTAVDVVGDDVFIRRNNELEWNNNGELYERDII